MVGIQYLITCGDTSHTTVTEKYRDPFKHVKYKHVNLNATIHHLEAVAVDPT